MSLVEGGGRQYGRRALVGIALGPDGPVRAFAPFRLSTYNTILGNQGLELAARFIAWQASLVIEALEARHADVTRTDWSIQTPEELMQTGAPL